MRHPSERDGVVHRAAIEEMLLHAVRETEPVARIRGELLREPARVEVGQRGARGDAARHVAVDHRAFGVVRQEAVAEPPVARPVVKGMRRQSAAGGKFDRLGSRDVIAVDAGGCCGANRA